MTWKSISTASLVVLLAAGCVRSLHRLYTEEDLLFTPELVGVWGEQEEQNTWTFERAGGKAYRLCYVEAAGSVSDARRRLPAGDTAFFDAHLVRLGGHLFMDLFPSQLDVSTNLCMVHMLPVHTIWKVMLSEDGLEMAMLNQDWLQDMIDGGKLKIQHERVNGEIVLTAPTKVLQELVIAYASDPAAFSEPARLKKGGL